MNEESGPAHSFVIKDTALNKESGKLQSQIGALARTVSLETGIAVLKVSYATENQRQILRVTISHPEGVTLDLCETFSRALSKLLDQEDIIKDQYYLEVESPGI